MILDDMIAGKVGRIVSLREKDYGKGLAKKLTIYNQKISETLLQLEQLNRQLELCASEQELSVVQQRIKELSTEFQTILESYTIEE
jgi:ppGpp synthetase/RelA/SpoT-type nucleotidyltranferase